MGALRRSISSIILRCIFPLILEFTEMRWFLTIIFWHFSYLPPYKWDEEIPICGKFLCILSKIQILKKDIFQYSQWNSETTSIDTHINFVGSLDKIPQIGWFQTTEICHHLMVCKARSPKSGCQLGLVLTEASGEGNSLPLLASGRLRCSLAHGNITPVSTSVFL